MVGRPRSTPGFRFACWLTLAALFGALAAGVWTFDTGRAQDDQAGDFPPDGYPRSVVAGDEQFLFDRLIPLDTSSLAEIGTDGDVALFAASDSGPFERVFADLDGGGDGEVGRYLPLQLGSGDPTCLTDNAELSVITTGDGANYAFAGEETDISAETLVNLGVADFGDGAERTLSSDRSEPPFPEFFVSGDQGEQLRFVLLTNDVPEQLTGEIPIGDQTFTVDGNVAGQVDPASLIDIACVGPFPLRAANDVTAPYSELYAPVGNGLLRLVAQDANLEDEQDAQGDADAVETGTPEDDGAGDQVAGEDAEDQPVDEAGTDEDTGTTDATTDSGIEDEEADDGEDTTQSEGQIPPLPEDAPAEVTVGEERFILDRSVPLDRGDLERVDRQGSQILYARAEEGPFDAVYLSLPPRNETALARYLPERVGQGGAACLAEAAPNSTLEFDGVQYLFAGYETDITTDSLTQIETSDGTEVYTDSVGGDGAELFLPDDTGLGRFVPIGADGRPDIAADSVTFAGADFTFVGDVTAAIDPASLAVAGCFGPFPVYTDPSVTEPPYGVLYLVAGGLVFQYTSDGGTPVLEAPTESPTEVPTEVATEVPTDVPTETPVPTDVPTEVPTETPAPTDVPTETPIPTEVPTETPVPTEVPTETAVPTETPPPTEAPTEAPAATEAPTETVPVEEEPTEEPEATEPSAAVPTSTPLPPIAPPPPELPGEIQVQSASYLFSDVTVDVDVTTLVQVEVIVVNNVELTVYARQEFQGAAPELFCVGPGGQVVGRYVPAAVVRPQPPQELPQELETEGNTYVFNQVNVNIDITTLVQVNVVVVQNVELALYAPQNVSGTPTLLYAVAPGGQIVGVYVQATIVTGAATPTPTPQLQPPAVVPTLPPNAAPPPASTAAVSRCTGSPGGLDVNGLPERLPRRIQYRGTAFSFVSTEAADEAGSLTRLGCAGPFDVYSTDQAPANERLYLRFGDEPDNPLYRFDAARTFTVEVEVTGQIRVVRTSDANYELVDSYQRSIYSSVTAILFVQDAEDPEPDVIYALRVDADVIGRYEPESDSLQAPSGELAEQARTAYINPDLLLNGRRYVLTEILTPQGTTTNGFVTLYAIPSQETPDLFLGVDPRDPDLLVFRRVGDGT